MAASRAARNAARLADETAVENTETPENTEMTEQTTTETAVAETEKPERVRRSPAERAQARLDAAKKRLAKATARRDKVRTLIADAEKDVVRAEKEVAFRLDDEDLPEQTEQTEIDVNAPDTDDETVADV